MSPCITYPCGLAISFALPILAQEQSAAPNRVRPVDPQDRQQIEAALMKFQEAYNKRDAAAIAALPLGRY